MVMSCWAWKEGQRKVMVQRQECGVPMTRTSSYTPPNLCNLLFIVHNKEWNTEQNGTEFFHSLLKLANCGELVAQLQPLDKVIKFQAHSWYTILQPCILPRKGKGGRRQTIIRSSRRFNFFFWQHNHCESSLGIGCRRCKPNFIEWQAKDLFLLGNLSFGVIVTVPEAST